MVKGKRWKVKRSVGKEETGKKGGWEGVKGRRGGVLIGSLLFEV